MIIFGLNNRIDVATITSTGAFETTLPLTNIKSPRLAEVARTTSAAAFSITIDLSAKAARGIGCVAIAGHNLSASASVQIITSQGATQIDDSFVLAAWPFLAFDDPHWNSHAFIGSIIDPERIAALTPTLIYFLSANQAANKVIITITDTGNADGYIEIGRLFVGEQLALKMGEEYGDSSFQIVDYSNIQSTQTRAKYAYNYPRLRTLTVSFKHLSQGEAIGGLYAAQQRGGLMGEVVVAPAYWVPTYISGPGKYGVDSNWFARAFLGNFSQFDGLSNPYFAAHALTISVEEVAK